MRENCVMVSKVDMKCSFAALRPDGDEVVYTPLRCAALRAI